MIKIEAGMLARSLAGHDKNKLYIIIRTDAEYVWLADGVYKTLEKPKKKKKRHIQVIHRIPDPVRDVLKNREILADEHIRQAIQAESRNRQEDKQCLKQM